MLPVPLAVVQLDPAVALHVHVALLRLPGRESFTTALVTFPGPRLVTTMLYVTVMPGIT